MQLLCFPDGRVMLQGEAVKLGVIVLLYPAIAWYGLHTAYKRRHDSGGGNAALS